MKHLIITIAIFVIPFVASGAPDTSLQVHSGSATYYKADGSGNCMFGPSPDNLMVCAINQVEYDSSAACGSWIRIKGPRGEIDVRVVDRCHGCKEGDIDLSKEAFEKISPLSKGRVPITWSYIDAPVSGPIGYKFKESSSKWWMALQIVNHRTAIRSVEIRYGNSWLLMQRQNYNYFSIKRKGGIDSPYVIRVTDIYGSQLIDTDLSITFIEPVPGQDNFASRSYQPDSTAHYVEEIQKDDSLTANAQTIKQSVDSYSTPENVIVLSSKKKLTRANLVFAQD